MHIFCPYSSLNWVFGSGSGATLSVLQSGFLFCCFVRHIILVSALRLVLLISLSVDKLRLIFIILSVMLGFLGLLNTTLSWLFLCCFFILMYIFFYLFSNINISSFGSDSYLCSLLMFLLCTVYSNVTTVKP